MAERPSPLNLLWHRGLPPFESLSAAWQGPCASFSRTNMKRVQALTVDLSQALPLAWPLLLAEIAAAALLFCSGRVPAVVVGALQLFLRF